MAVKTANLEHCQKKQFNLITFCGFSKKSTGTPENLNTRLLVCFWFCLPKAIVCSIDRSGMKTSCFNVSQVKVMAAFLVETPSKNKFIIFLGLFGILPIAQFQTFVSCGGKNGDVDFNYYASLMAPRRRPSSKKRFIIISLPKRSNHI